MAVYTVLLQHVTLSLYSFCSQRVRHQWPLWSYSTHVVLLQGTKGGRGRKGRPGMKGVKGDKGHMVSLIPQYIYVYTYCICMYNTLSCTYINTVFLQVMPKCSDSLQQFYQNIPALWEVQKDFHQSVPDIHLKTYLHEKMSDNIYLCACVCACMIIFV